MIEYVVKANGERQEFNAEKLNKWADWAAEECGISWSDIAIAASKKCYNGCKTSELHQAMISACVDKEDTAHLQMAARLLIGSIYKEVYGSHDAIKTIPVFYHEMVSAGHWEDMGYSDSDLNAIEYIINHSKDFTYTYSELKQFVDKYAIQSVTDRRIYESPQMMYTGMAMAAMKDQPLDRRIDDLAKLYEYLSDRKINTPTPYLNGLRTNSKGFASCCVIAGDDTAPSLGVAEHIAYTMTYNKAGIGIFLNTRSIKDPVKNGATEHLGKLPYYRTIDAAVKANTQVSRGGSATVHYNVLDPQIEDLLMLKNPTTPDQKRINFLDYSVGVNKFFVQKVAKNEDWMLTSLYHAPELHKLFYSNDVEGFHKEYNRVINDDSVKKRIVKARDIALKILEQRVETGRVYIHWVDEINNHTPFKDAIYSSNLCVAPETQILTDNGYIPIAELEGETVNVWNGDEWSETVVRKTGENQKLIRVITSSGHELECTPYHKFYVFNGYGKPYIEKRAHELSDGDKLAKFDLPIVYGDRHLENAYINGFYSGDGCFTDEGQRIYLYHEKRKLDNLFNGGGKWTIQDQYNRQYKHYRNLKDKFFVPSSDYSIQSRLDWLAGWLDADGCVYRCGTNEQLVASSIELNFLREVQMMMQTLGVSAKINHMYDAGYKFLPANDGTGELKEFWCQESWRLCITSCDSYKLLCMGLNLHRLDIKKRKPQRDAKQFNKVISVIDEGRIDDTYCFNEPKRHMGMFNGILTGQCQEICLPTAPYQSMDELYGHSDTEGEIALCFLSAIVAGRVRPSEYEDVAYYTLLMIDNVIDGMHYPFKQMAETARARRSVGVGITNLAYDMANRGFTYDSPAGKNYVHRLAELHSYSLHRASLRLAKEKGVCDYMDKTKYPEGWLPIDTYNQQVDSAHSQPLMMDWESLRNDIRANGGIRHSVLEAYMPAESSSLASNTCNSIYPVRQLTISKKSRKGSVFFMVPGHDDLKDAYQFAWDVPTKDMIDIYAIIQKFTGQAISADFYLDYTKLTNGKVSNKELLQNFIYATKMGMKTQYYLNSRVSVGSGIRDNIQESGCAGGACSL